MKDDKTAFKAVEKKTHFDAYKLLRQLVNSKNHILGGGSQVNQLGTLQTRTVCGRLQSP